MAFLTGRRSSVFGLYNHHRNRPILSIATQSSNSSNSCKTACCYLMPSSSSSSSSSSCLLLLLLLLLHRNRRRSPVRKRWLSTSTKSTPSDLTGKNAYELLGVSETSSFSEIKASFRKLAKETHPDLAHAHSHSHSQSHNHSSSASHRFVQILAAYEILSDSEKRAHYDGYLLSQRMCAQRCSRQVSVMYAYESHRTTMKQMEAVEWLKWYRFALNDILSEKRVVVGSGYFDVMERDFYSAIYSAYYGPVIESMDLLPDCFEAEERSSYGTPEVLHLVSGRDLFGMICLADEVPELSESYHDKLTSFASGGSGLCKAIENLSIQANSGIADVGIRQIQAKNIDYHASDAYKDLKLHVSGKVVAVATRAPPKSCNGISNENSQDHIHVYLSLPEDPMYMSKGFSRDSFMGVAVGSSIPLGTITGLGTNPDEGSCFVYNSNGIKTHVIMKHRTLMVKHMHWYQVGDKVSVCECRCSRAQLPPSKFWLFEPRCGMHDIGGWYVETFGRDRKGRTVPSRRYWDGFDAVEPFKKRLHPAMYLLALAYRTLDLEDAKRRKQTVRDIVEGKFSGIVSWCKKLV